MTRLRLALFDMDGTLVDSQGHIKRSVHRAFAAQDLPVPTDAAILSIVGLSLPQAFERLVPGLAPAQRDQMVETYKSGYAHLRKDEGAASSPMFAGALACLDALEADDAVLLGIATGKSRRGLTHVLEAHDLAGRFVTTQVADDHPSKPHPSMVEAALTATGVEASACVMIGDTSYDMDMGRAAGVKTLGVSWGYHPVAQLTAADALAQSFDEVPGLLRTLWGDDDV